jgi:DnaJ-domain-containing protein 1
LNADAKVKAKTEAPAVPAENGFAAVKSRLERWLTSIDLQDPYQILGVSPRDSDETIRNRYRELALRLHPDRGGSNERMRIVNNAFERITRHREKTPTSAGPG